VTDFKQRKSLAVGVRLGVIVLGCGFLHIEVSGVFYVVFVLDLGLGEVKGV
jgi:hypothetical protein